MKEFFSHQTSLAFARAATAAHQRDYRFHVRDSWNPDRINVTVPESAKVLYEERSGSYSRELIYATDSEIVFYDYSVGSSLSLTVYAASIEEAQAVLDAAREAMPETRSRGNEIRVLFWNYSPHGPTNRMRRLVAPAWDEIKENYSAPTAQALRSLLDATPDPVTSGKLILWHGEPGTGKTFALRALARHWGEWATIHYIIDPEHFFGQHAEYMVSVLLGGEDAPSPIVEGGKSSSAPRQEWRLIVLEDTGELLSKDAKERAGQALSRLLNVCDGLIGQGLRVLVLITTNEDVGTLHDAVVRPGRCLADVKFESLSADECATWCAAHEIGLLDTRKRRTLAELFALSENSEPRSRPLRVVGFGRD